MNRMPRVIRRLVTAQLEEQSLSLQSYDMPDSMNEKIPVELICKILSFTAPRTVISVQSARNPTNTEPWTLAHVCSVWRAIVLADASLWTNVVISFGRSACRFAKRFRLGHAARLRRTLQLSRPCSISFHLALTPDVVHSFCILSQQKEQWFKTAIKLFGILGAEKSRMLALDIPNLPTFIPMLGPGTWDCLAELKVSRFDPWFSLFSHVPMSLTAPDLKRVTVSVRTIENLDVAWEQISNFVIETYTLNGQAFAAPRSDLDHRDAARLFSKLHQASGALETLQVRTLVRTEDLGVPGSSPHGPPWTLPKLKSLAILSAARESTDDQEGFGFLDMTLCPALEILYVESATHLSELADFMKLRASDALHTLILGRPLLRERASESWASLLEAAPSLRTIVLVGLQSEHPLIDVLLCKADELQHIFLVNVPDPVPLIDEFSKMWVTRPKPTWEAEWKEFVTETTDAVVKMARHSGSLDILDPANPARERNPEWKVLIPRREHPYNVETSLMYWNSWMS